MSPLNRRGGYRRGGPDVALNVWVAEQQENGRGELVLRILIVALQARHPKR